MTTWHGLATLFFVFSMSVWTPCGRFHGNAVQFKDGVCRSVRLSPPKIPSAAAPPYPVATQFLSMTTCRSSAKLNRRPQWLKSEKTPATDQFSISRGRAPKNPRRARRSSLNPPHSPQTPNTEHPNAPTQNTRTPKHHHSFCALGVPGDTNRFSAIKNRQGRSIPFEMPMRDDVASCSSPARASWTK